MYTNSELVNYVNLSPNNSGERTHAIDTITIHCVVGQCSVETLGEIFARPSRQASSNYGVGVDGRIGMYVEEKNRSWCSSSNANDQRAITIEVASDTAYPYAVRDNVYESMLNLCVDICKRNGKKKMVWCGSLEATNRRKFADDEMRMTLHRWFASTICPGEYLVSRMQKIADEVTKRLEEEDMTYAEKQMLAAMEKDIVLNDETYKLYPDMVKFVRSYLNYYGFVKFINTKWGTALKKAIKKWQKSVELPETGEIAEADWVMMRKG